MLALYTVKRSKVRAPRLLLAASFVLAACSGGACSAPAHQDPDGELDEAAQQEAELGSEEESFSRYEASDEELATAQPEAPLDNEMTLFAIPAPKLLGLSWRRPGGLARRTLLNVGLGFSRALGHAAVRLSCEGRTFTGSVYDTGNEFQTMVMNEKAGLGVLFRTVPGTMEQPEELQSTFAERYGSGRISFIRFALSRETCSALLDYAKAFTAANIAKEYGFVRPLCGNGGEDEHRLVGRDDGADGLVPRDVRRRPEEATRARRERAAIDPKDPVEAASVDLAANRRVERGVVGQHVRSVVQSDGRERETHGHAEGRRRIAARRGIELRVRTAVHPVRREVDEEAVGRQRRRLLRSRGHELVEAARRTEVAIRCRSGRRPEMSAAVRVPSREVHGEPIGGQPREVFVPRRC